MNLSIFREYDIRGLVDPDLTPDVVRDVQRAYGTYMYRRGFTTVIIARDSRDYNSAIHQQAVEALKEIGMQIVDIGVVTVPVFYFAQLYYKITAGVMVTASHNPVGWSGFKQLVGMSQTATTAELEELKKLIANKDFESGEGSYEERSGVVAAYAKDALSRVHIARPIKAVVDCGNETAALVNPEILRQAGITVIEQDTTIGAPTTHEPNPSTLGALEHIREGVLVNKADIGIGYDADGDRFGVVDDQGEIIWPDRVAMVLVRKILQENPGGSVVFDVKCTQALIDEIVADGGKPVMWKTGHSWIRRKGQEVDAVFAAERSGHFYFRRGHWGYDDGLFVTLKLLEIIAGQEKPLHEVMKDFPHYETSPVWHAPCADEVKYAVVERLVEDCKKEYGEDKVVTVNGARVQFDDGWGLVRASSNIPALVLVFEGKTAEALKRISSLFETMLTHYPEIAPRDKWESG
ncbi:phosphomannomutase/phosphoglucomutase [Candidatus Uhrbacteria bacterium CG10_big_fil_rev_8_21_14_0_10_48_11]|uniref:Phosphomannomutase/phosphoglucomutase n=1 Tax=Candidatus Uhrbacteria bacterium CG10_big_fil_rev_8_21_14_0_10_48_11 TaxID=1975037 RepID=A0A2M8LDP1_9BACT|nr:MAG: phosphomannomutase/phosphoglucomutase [Candidatus Uhrbacteria bacterium CG10_big_fil_rev_8_21_14_0_10_48_11]